MERVWNKTAEFVGRTFYTEVLTTCCSSVFCNKKVPSSHEVDTEDEESISEQDGFPGSPVPPENTQGKGKKKKIVFKKFHVKTFYGHEY